MLTKKQTERVLKRYKQLEHKGSFFFGLLALLLLIYLAFVVSGADEILGVVWDTILH